jgi:hypothetical protein
MNFLHFLQSQRHHAESIVQLDFQDKFDSILKERVDRVVGFLHEIKAQNPITIDSSYKSEPLFSR